MAMKGAGKGKPSVNCNVPGMPNSSIDGLPYAGVAVFRESADQAVEFCTKLQAAMAPYAAGEVHFENIDVSNIQWPLIAFSLLLEVLQEKGASTKRLKAFKAGLDDECMNCTATWIEQLKPETLPSEIHLSHNSISQKGLETLLNAIERQRAQLPRQAMPIWLRVENNQVDISEQSTVIQALLAQGRVVLATKIGDRVPSAAAVAMPDFKKAWSQGGQPQRAGPAPRQLSADDPCEDRPDLLWDAVGAMGIANYNCVFLSTGWIPNLDCSSSLAAFCQVSCGICTQEAVCGEAEIRTNKADLAIVLNELGVCENCSVPTGNPPMLPVLKDPSQYTGLTAGGYSSATPGDPCNVSGIVCDRCGGLQHIWLGFPTASRIQGCLTPSLLRMHRLKHLFILKHHSMGAPSCYVGPDWSAYLPDLSVLALNGLLTGPTPDLYRMRKLRSVVFKPASFTGRAERLFGQPGITIFRIINTIPFNDTVPESICNSQKLVGLELINSFQGGSLPPCMEDNLTSLTSLQIQGNGFYGSVAPALGSEHLLKANLESNLFSGTLPERVSNMTELSLLNLRSNRLRGALPDLSRLAKLATLDVTDNNLTGSGRLSGDRLYVSFAGNSLATFPEAWMELPGVVSLDVSRNPLREWPRAGVYSRDSFTPSDHPGCLKDPDEPPFDWPAMETLHADHCALDNVEARTFLTSLAAVSSIAVISASNSGLFDDLPMERFLLTPVADLSSCTDVWVEAGFPRLVTLDMSGNRISAISGPPWQLLRAADFSSNSIQSVHHSWFQGSVSNLDLRGNAELRLNVESASGQCPMPGAGLTATTGLLANPEGFLPADSAAYECTEVCNPGFELNVDSMVNASVLCRCAPGFWGDGMSCEPCSNASLRGSRSECQDFGQDPGQDLGQDLDTDITGGGNGGGDSTWVVILGSAGAAVLLVSVVLCYVYRRRARFARASPSARAHDVSSPRDERQPGREESTCEGFSIAEELGEEHTSRIFDDVNFIEVLDLGLREHWVIKASDIQLETTEVARGGFGFVARGMLLGSTEIAVKTPHDHGQARLSEANALANEVRLFRRIRHPNIVLFHGLTVAKSNGVPRMSLVLEWIGGGDFGRYIKRRRTNGQFEHAVEMFDHMHPVYEHIILADVVRGMQYLHGQDPPIMHRDLKPGNILIEATDPPRGKIADFGLSALMVRDLSSRAGTANYMAPEVREKAMYNKEADVFSFGCVCLYVLSDMSPRPERAEQDCRELLTVAKPALQTVAATGVACLRRDPSKRINFGEAFRMLKEATESALSTLDAGDRSQRSPDTPATLLNVSSKMSL